MEEETQGDCVTAGRQKEGTDKDKDKDKEWVEGEDDCDMLGALVEVLVAIVAEMRNMVADWRHMEVESHAQMECMLGTLEEIQGCLDLEFALEEPEEEYKEKEVAVATTEREGWKAWSGVERKRRWSGKFE
ncbi:hypothetical protein BS17DRAFT_821996 [Gyrodon lividus]|nr:hypothetical protein BS17DRAFT_821996 [Gyrodon lividus]